MRKKEKVINNTSALPESVWKVIEALEDEGLELQSVEIECAEDQDDEEIICAVAVEKFGDKHQIMKAIEELSELQRALARYMAWREQVKGGTKAGRALVNNIREELVDVCIMCMQLEHIFGHDPDIAETKLARLRELVEMER